MVEAMIGGETSHDKGNLKEHGTERKTEERKTQKGIDLLRSE